MECNYIFLDEAERKSMAVQSHDYLIERVYRVDREGIVKLRNDRSSITKSYQRDYMDYTPGGCIKVQFVEQLYQ